MSAITINGNTTTVIVHASGHTFTCYVCGDEPDGQSMFQIPLSSLTSNDGGMSSWVCAECLGKALNSSNWSLMNTEAIDALGGGERACGNCSEPISSTNGASFCDNCYSYSCSNCGDAASTLCWSCGESEHEECATSCYECGDNFEYETVLCTLHREQRDKQVLEDAQPVVAAAAGPVNSSITTSDEGVELTNAMGDSVEVKW